MIAPSNLKAKIMQRTDVVIIGGGQAGLSLSRCLVGAGISHIVLESGKVGQRWRSGSWNSLRLLTPNWLNNLAHQPYTGRSPDDFMTAQDFIATLDAYASSCLLPIETNCRVAKVTKRAGIFIVEAERGSWAARSVVIATGHCQEPSVGELEKGLPDNVMSMHASQYRSPALLPAGPVLVVGASASGVQIADEIAASGRETFLSVGRHTRVPRRWRGFDLFWWFNKVGILSERTCDFPYPEGARRQPSLQLAGRAGGNTIDLAYLQRRGVRLAGRISGVGGRGITFADDLEASIFASDVKLARLLARFDDFAKYDLGLPADRIDPIRLTERPLKSIQFGAEGIANIIWATGYRRTFPWLDVDVLGADSEISHTGGKTAVPGLFALGFRFLRKRDSSFIGGSASDAQAIAREISCFLTPMSQKSG
jgi:putative flavoprotein involved in K+ transport